MSSSVLVVAAEASSSLYAQRLLQKWTSVGADVQAFGIGSRGMEAVGFECLGRSEEMAVVGLQEVIQHFPLIRRVYKNLLAEAEKRRPKFALLLDYPDFNLRLAKDLKKLGIPVIYYISPQVWAWRTGRVKHIRKYIDHMLVLFPFEEEFYKKNGVQTTFVGHPLLDELQDSLFSEEHRQRHRQRFSIRPDEIVLGLMPGSRHSELKYNLQEQLKAADILSKANAKIKPVLLIAPTLRRQDIQPYLENWPHAIQMVQDEPFQMISLTDVIICASGTATLMVGLMEKPMVIMYRMNSVTAWLAKRLVRSTPFFGMANLILNRRAVPELFQEQADAVHLASEVQSYLQDPNKKQETVAALHEIRMRLGDVGATDKVFQVLNGYL